MHEAGGAGRRPGLSGEPCCPHGRPGLLGCHVVVEVLEEYFGLGLRHGEPSTRGDGEPCDDDMQLRVTGKVVTVVTGRTEEIQKVEPAIILELSLL